MSDKLINEDIGVELKAYLLKLIELYPILSVEELNTEYWFDLAFNRIETGHILLEKYARASGYRVLKIKIQTDNALMLINKFGLILFFDFPLEYEPLTENAIEISLTKVHELHLVSDLKKAALVIDYYRDRTSLLEDITGGEKEVSIN